MRFEKKKQKYASGEMVHKTGWAWSWDEETHKKQKLSRTGKKKGPYENFNHEVLSVQVNVHGVIFQSIAEAERAIGCSKRLIRMFVRDPYYIPQRSHKRKQLTEYLLTQGRCLVLPT